MATRLTDYYSLRARYIFPIDRAPIRDSWMTVSQGRIVAVDDTPTAERRDLGDVVILPGLINTHTHLEFNDLDQPLGEAGMPFPDWIREVVCWRRRAFEESASSNWRDAAVRRGLDESIRGGATVLGEIATPPWGTGVRRYREMQGVCFFELLELATARHDELLASASETIEAAHHRLSPKLGLSPHAPYTVSPKLVESVAALSAKTRTPVAMHLAETREELELLRSGGGPFRELLDELGAWQSEPIPRESMPLNYLKLLAKANRALVIHGNYLSHKEIDFAGQSNRRMSVVYCPRTHAYFGHESYPLQEMLERGVNVTLGTDSRASNPDLNLLSEVRFAARQHPNISPESILRLATIHAAKALGMDQTHGTLTPGKQADFIVIAISPNKCSDPHELVFESVHGVQQVFRSGEQLLAV